MNKMYDSVCIQCSELVTKKYSTSFSLGISMFHKSFRPHIYSIYGFVRFADEIVDTFYNFDQKEMLNEFRNETLKAIENKFSMNPILHSFQGVVNKYDIELDLIEAFLKSMEMDLYLSKHTLASYNEYIYGSAEVIGLMCLKVFLENDSKDYNELKPYACRLGSAFQKINFLRDIKSDYKERGRVYFPEVNFDQFSDEDKQQIERDIENDFKYAYIGVLKLPVGVRSGVLTAYTYYYKLFEKIKALSFHGVFKERVRISDSKKLYLAVSIFFSNKIKKKNRR